MANFVAFSKSFKLIYRLPHTSVVRYSVKTPSTLGEDEYVKDEDEAQKIAEALYNEVDVEAIEAEIEKKRNKSGLLPAHLRILQKQLPYNQPHSWIHKSLKYNRNMYGRYGAASGVDPRLLFPTDVERSEKQEYERVAHPKTLKEMIAENKQRKIDEASVIAAREKEIALKVGKLKQWTTDLNAKIAKREAEAKAAVEKKQRLVEEVRQHFGFKIDPKDPRFQEMLEKKQLEEKKAKKVAKRELLEKKMLGKIMASSMGEEQPKPAPVKAKKPEEPTAEEVITESKPIGRGGKNKK